MKKVRKSKSKSITPQEVFRYLPIIQVLGKLDRDGASRKYQEKVLQLSPQTVRAMGNIVQNALVGNVLIKPTLKQAMQNNEIILRQFSAPGRSIAAQRRLLLQKQNELLPLIHRLLPAASHTIKKVLNTRCTGI